MWLICGMFFIVVLICIVIGIYMCVCVVEVFLSCYWWFEIILIYLNVNFVMNCGFNVFLVVILVISFFL